MPSNQSGIAQVLLLLMLVAGVIVGTYVVQQRTNLIPHACVPSESEDGCATDDNPSSDDPAEEEAPQSVDPDQQDQTPAEEDKQQSETQADCDAKQKTECRDGQTWKNYVTLSSGSCVENWQSTGESCGNGLTDHNHGEQNPNQTPNQGSAPSDGSGGCNDNLTYCQDGKAIHKHGGYKDGDKCVYDFYAVPEEDSSCSSDKGSKNGDVVKDDPALIQQKNEERADSAKGAQCQSIVYCDTGKAYKKISVYDDNAAKCVEQPIVNVSEMDNKCKDDKGSNAAQGTVISSEDTSKKPGEQGYYASSINRDIFKASSDLQRTDLKKTITTATANLSSITDPTLKTKIQADIKAAQDALDSATTAAAACNTEADCTSAFAANTSAVAKSRAALAEAIAAGVPGVTVKADLNIGGNNKNTAIYARASTGGGSSRLFARTKSDGTVEYVVRNDANQLVPANADDLKAAGLTQNQTPAQFSTWVASRLTNVSAVTSITPTDSSKPSPVPSLTPHPSSTVRPSISPSPSSSTSLNITDLKPQNPSTSQSPDTTSETVNFNRSNGTTAVTVTVTKPKAGNTGAGQTQFKINSQLFEVKNLTTTVRTNQDLQNLFTKWLAQNPGKQLPKLLP